VTDDGLTMDHLKQPAMRLDPVVPADEIASAARALWQAMGTRGATLADQAEAALKAAYASHDPTIEVRLRQQIAREIAQAAHEAGGYTPNGIGYQRGLQDAARIALGKS
jgi:hypothetical protein